MKELPKSEIVNTSHSLTLTPTLPVATCNLVNFSAAAASPAFKNATSSTSCLIVSVMSLIFLSTLTVMIVLC